ncbi:hypothetical protein Kpol_1018p22 [Vanderwaltozyma polyspora DSM 70294]|uniref:Transcriptional coactivator HFI1/ADA1 n=1 Tax=Vanderwaltozyma polyspora (strain ATCC 22028 / DSM 70294 / BCRC 21397 / CBS 2163 / NBRC 10782 / NRRL Y-8283 / UCD 57-17) TaxID=436907 RepID=A7TDM4_VANPO|nr:uncharacterized protein Kpol_1018p22 [Vanderwaltozyma polyspora DSM 70294]EDO19494.1 hypothetical protein Kpol_1018p22 [Vanderwaltozyma polyspora DSM 70294]
MSVVKSEPAMFANDSLNGHNTQLSGTTSNEVVQNKLSSVVSTPIPTTIMSPVDHNVAGSATSVYSNQRIDLEPMIEEFNTLLGRENWVKYAQVISLFMLGKLSRKELSNEMDLLFVSPISSDLPTSFNKTIRRTLIRLHNQLLLGIFSNSLRESPLGRNADGSWGFGNGNPNINKLKRANKHNSQIEMYKKIVMSLPMLDRQRLKAITKESGKRGFVLCSVLQARLNMIPKVPIVTNPDTLKHIKENNLKSPIEWTQDIMNGFNAPLATDSFSLPDTDSLYLRMIGISREHGLVGAVDTNSVELLSLALDQFLKNIVESAIDTVRYRKKKYSDFYDLDDSCMYKPMDGGAENNNDADGDPAEGQTISLTNEDIYETFTLFPNLIQSDNSKLNLSSVGLVNDDELVIYNSTIDDLPDFMGDKPSFTPSDDRNVGTREELNWLIKDMLTEK